MNFRKYTTKSGKLILGGKSAENNESLIRQAEADEYVLHTKAPGSPFVNIKAEGRAKGNKEDIKEAAVFCAVYSQDWKKNKNKDVEVHLFKGRDIQKRRGMKIGTFGVKKFKVIKVKKGEIEGFK